jgi:quercetin dioxygenase-like cupin family protein
MTRPAHVVDPRDAETVAVLGPTVTFLTPPADGAPCLMRGTIPPSGSVPLHSHADPETFVVLEGAVEGLVMTGGGHRWVGLGAGDVFHVPGDVPHAWRNPRPEPVTTHIVSTAKMAAFFREVGTPVGEAPPPLEEELQRFLETADRYGYWNATPEENARVGLAMPAPGS